MSKSILILDTPEACGKCRFVNEFWCRANGRILSRYDTLPIWCPLNPFPEKSTIENDMTDYQCGMVDGRNQCIDEITGGEKNENSCNCKRRFKQYM